MSDGRSATIDHGPGGEHKHHHHAEATSASIVSMMALVTAFTAATAYTVTFWLRHPESPWRWLVLGLAGVAGLTVGLLKIRAGYHFPTDIAAGAVVGVSVGTLIPLLHRIGG